MKKIIIGSIMTFALIFSSCGAAELAEKEDKHQNALAAFNKAVKEFNEHIDVLCDCYKEAGDAYGCERKHGSYSFTSTEEMDSLEEFNMDHVEEGIKRLKECKAEGLKNAG